MTDSSPAVFSEELLILDSRVQVSEHWLASIAEKIAVFRVDADQDGLSQLAAIMEAHSGVKSLHLVSHGRPGALSLGAGQIDADRLIQDAALLQYIGSRLAPGADLLLYGCDVAAGETGQTFVDILARLTGLNIAASDDATGDSASGGDWELETTSGAIGAAALRLAGLQGLLVLPTLTTGDDAPALSSIDDTVIVDLANSLNAGDTIDGQDGVDTLEISAAQTVVLGAATLTNVETITISAGIQSITTHDATVGSGQTLTVDASASAAALTWNGGAEMDGIFSLTGGTGKDSVTGGAGADTLRGGDGNDTIRGQSGDDQIYGEGNNDTLYGGDGVDTLYGGDGNDFVYADEGGQVNDDLLYGEAGNDGMSGGAGDDTLYGGDNNDTLIGGLGNDFFYGDGGNDWLWGQDNDDILYGGAGNDTVSGDAGNDTLYGGDGNDTVSGHAGNDTLYGGADNDLLLGVADADVLYGDGGSDTLSGGAGADTLYGDADADTFSGSAADLDGDTLADFTLDDSIVVTGLDLSALNGTAASGTIDLGSGQSVTLTGISSGSGTFGAVFGGGNTTITLTAPVPGPEPEPEPEPPVIEEIDGVTIQTVTDSSGNQTVTIPIVPTSRQDDPSTPLATHADVPLASSTSGQVLLNLGVPISTGVTVQGPIDLVSGGAASINLLQSIVAVTPSASARNDMIESVRSFVDNLPENTRITVKTITPTTQTSGASAPLVISGTGGQEAILIDTHSLPPGSTIQLDNIDFALIVGPGRVVGGEGSNQAIGDDKVQFIVLGADDDNLHGGGGNDTVGSLSGNDQTSGDDGDDRVYGGTDHDSLNGGQGNDSLNGGFGFDVALEAGQRTDYDIEIQGEDVVLTHLATGDVDRLTDIEQVHFSAGEILTIAHNEMEAVAYHLVSTWLNRNLTLEEAALVQDIRGASTEDLVLAFKQRFPLEQVQQLGTAELLAGLEDNPDIIRLSEHRNEYAGGSGNDQGYLPLGAALTVDGAGGHDVLRLEGDRDDYHLEARDGALEITRYQDGAMISLHNAEMLSFDSGETTVLAHDTEEAVLGRLVQTFLGRDASVEEWALGRAALAADTGYDSILNWFEDRAGLQQLDDADYVQALYQNTFGRQANATELQAHLARLDEPGFDRSWLAIDIAQSEQAIAVVGSVMQFDNWI